MDCLVSCDIKTCLLVWAQVPLPGQILPFPDCKVYRNMHPSSLSSFSHCHARRGNNTLWSLRQPSAHYWQEIRLLRIRKIGKRLGLSKNDFKSRHRWVVMLFCAYWNLKHYYPRMDYKISLNHAIWDTESMYLILLHSTRDTVANS